MSEEKKEVKFQDLVKMVEALQEQNKAQAAEIQDLRASKSVTPDGKPDARKKITGPTTIQHIRPMRQWTVVATRVLKIHNGRVRKFEGDPKREKNIVLQPGCIVTVEPELAKMLIRSKDFQHYGL